ncbi:CBS domain-containing protein [Streptomyces chiangmaiensis]|uniref:CBS domain-containing protein n=1 Tax=Streptomyces chiangmaiensis TaxID=766497 RepID=A0ABU7FV77_9ACTN|nr:CBS domain-containing protein [Streptomyces chiangmaiensis]MED7827982.1 CBS domain-containing protein [Streptomyces chiangmaiensis]
MAQQVREVMTDQPLVVGPSRLVQQIATVMRDENIGAVLVVDNGRLRGLVTDQDLIMCILADGSNGTSRTVAEACSGELITVAPDDDVGRAVQLMRSKALRWLPVVDNGRPVGVIALGDLTAERDPDSP